MLSAKQPPIVSGSQIAKTFNENAWQLQSYQEIIKRTRDKNFPCHFGRISEESDITFYGFSDSTTTQGDRALIARYLTDFTNIVKNTSEIKRYTFLLVIKPEEKEESLQYYEPLFWDLLKHLHQVDREPWPSRVSTDPNNGDFEFCFNGVSLFNFANTPAYKKRLSRNLGSSLVIVFIPASSFYGAKLLTKGGIAARKEIRKRLSQYDLVDHYPEFGEVDKGIPLSWKSYFIPDENITLTKECPFTFIPKNVAST